MIMAKDSAKDEGVGRTVLVVDDEPDTVDFITLLLNKRGYAVLPANSGADALATLDKHDEVDLVLLDLRMPGLSGADVLRTVRADERTATLPIVILSVNTETKDKVNALGLGADDYIEKPFRKEELFARIRAHIHRKTLREELEELNRTLDRKVMQRTMELFLEKEFSECLIENASDIICVLDREGRFVRVNRAAERLLGHGKEELLGQALISYVVPEHVPILTENRTQRLRGADISPYDVDVVTSDDSRRTIEIGTSLVKDESGEFVEFMIARDITERKRAEEEMRRRLMRYRLKEGTLYLVEEHGPGLALEAFRDLLRAGYRALAITRTPGEEFRQDTGGEYELEWLAEQEGPDALPPELGMVETRIKGLSRRTAVLIERLDYLLFKNGFEATLSFVQRLREIAYVHGHVVVLALDPAAVTPDQRNLLENETGRIETQQGVRLPEDLMGILRFVHRQNLIGVKPPLSEIGHEFGMSRPTVRRKVKQLLAGEYVLAHQKGRSKVLELAPRGRRLFER
jgi:PAS domain S-box-containing protein